MLWVFFFFFPSLNHKLNVFSDLGIGRDSSIYICVRQDAGAHKRKAVSNPEDSAAAQPHGTLSSGSSSSSAVIGTATITPAVSLLFIFAFFSKSLADFYSDIIESRHPGYLFDLS